MRKKLVYLSVLFVSFCSYSAKADIKIQCPENIIVNEKFDCNIIGNFGNQKISGIAAIYNFSKNVEFISYKSASKWQYLKNDKNGFALLDVNGKIIEDKLGTITLKRTNKKSVTIDIKYDVSDSNYEIVKCSPSRTSYKAIKSYGYVCLFILLLFIIIIAFMKKKRLNR